MGIRSVPISGWSIRRRSRITQIDYSDCNDVGDSYSSQRNHSWTAFDFCWRSFSDVNCFALHHRCRTCSDFSGDRWNHRQLVSGFRLGTSQWIDKHGFNAGRSSRSSIDGVVNANSGMARFIFSDSTAGIFNCCNVVVVFSRLS